MMDDLGSVWRNAPPPDSPCPEDESLGSYAAGELDAEQQDEIREHLAACAACVARTREAQRFIDAIASPVAAPIRARLAANPWALGLAAIVIAAAGLSILWKPAKVDLDPFRTKAAYTPAGADVVWRGGDTTPPAAGSLGWAMEPYLRDDFASAAARLDLRLREHSGDDSATFYLGVSLVLLRRPAEAEPYLRRIAEGEGADAPEASWYLALALIDGGDGERATPVLERIAAGEGARRQAASRLLEALGRRRFP